MGNLDRIRRLSTILRLCIGLCIAAFLVGPPLFWANPSWLLSVPVLADHVPATLAGWQQWAGGATASAITLVGVWMLSALWRLFGLYRQGRIFEAENVRALHHFGIGLIAFSLTSIVGSTILILILTATAPVGQRILSIGIEGGQVVSVILGSVFLVIARVMDEGRLLREDQATIV